MGKGLVSVVKGWLGNTVCLWGVGRGARLVLVAFCCMKLLGLATEYW